MKDGVMAAIDCIAPVDIRRNGVPIRSIAPKSVGLVRRGVCSEAGLRIDIICLCGTPAWMIGGESKRIEILVGAHDRGKVVVMGIKGRRQLRFDYSASDA